MKRRQAILLAVSAVVVVVALAAAVHRYRENQPVGDAGFTMGTIPYTIAVVPGDVERDDALAAATQAAKAIRRVDRVMSTYLPGSDLSRLNAAGAGEAVKLDSELMTLLLRARSLTAATDEAFDPTGRGLFLLWKETFKTGKLPGDDAVAKLVKIVGWENLTFNAADCTVVKSDPAVQVDLGAIAKGHAVDVAVEELQKAGLDGGMVEVGGEVRVFGVSPKGSKWVLGIRNPFAGSGAKPRPAFAGTVAISDGAVATSGDYIQGRKIGKKRYSHIIDPRTGRPVTVAPSVTVIAPDCMTADTWATALSVLGPDGIARVEAIDGLEAMMVVGDPEQYKILTTSGFGQYVRDPMGELVP